MTEDEKEILKAGADAAIKPFSNLLEKLFGGCVEEIGGMWQDELKVRRLHRRLKLYKRVQRMIADAGIEPKRIPENIWMPVLQAASAQDDETLQEKWAALLTNASVAESDNEVLPSFPEILKQLTPVEAKLLDAVYDETVESAQGLKEAIQEGTLASAAPVTLGNLERLGLLNRHMQDTGFTSDLKFHTFGPTNHLFVSSFGRAFIRACRAPQANSLGEPGEP